MVNTEMARGPTKLCRNKNTFGFLQTNPQTDAWRVGLILFLKKVFCGTPYCTCSKENIGQLPCGNVYYSWFGTLKMVDYSIPSTSGEAKSSAGLRLISRAAFPRIRVMDNRWNSCLDTTRRSLLPQIPGNCSAQPLISSVVTPVTLLYF